MTAEQISALGRTLFAGLATGLGGLLALGPKPTPRALAGAMGFSAGVMTAVSLTDLLPTALGWYRRAFSPEGAALALVSQPLYAVALGHTNNAMYAVPFAQHPLRALYTFYIKSWETPSILLPLLLGLLLLLCIRERKYIPALLIYVLFERFSGSLDYGVGGFRLMSLFYLFLEYPALCFAVTTAYMLAWALDGRGYPIFGVQFGMRLFAVPAVVLASLPIRRKTQLPKWLTYGFYPAHLIILLILEKIF